MAKGCDHFEIHFQEILNNLSIELIAPLLTRSGIISADDQAELKKKSKKPAVKFVLQKVRDHDSGNLLFKECLANTSESQDHRNLVSILYSSESKDTSLGNVVNLYNIIMC